MAYTAQFGNGFSATISAEQRRTTQIIGFEGDNGGFNPITICGTVAPGGFPGAGGCYGGFQAPDVVANLRVDQAWGSAQIMGALHQVNALYYWPNSANRENGHPDDELGWVIGAGIKLNAPMIGQGDYFQAQVNYSQGALRYVFMTPNGNWGKIDLPGQGWGVLSDAVYVGRLGGVGVNAPSDLELTTAWGVNAAYEHFWNPRWRTSLYGGYAAVSYSDNANAIVCGFGNGGAVGAAADGCDMNWQTWWVGSRTQWNISKDFYMGVDVLYSKIEGATSFVTPAGAFAYSTTAGVRTLSDDVDNLAIRFRVHRDFYP
jgi:hypothetical protein